MKVQIQTTQNVEIEYDLATVGDRIGAAIIDLLVIIGYLIGMNAVLGTILTEAIIDGTSGTIFMVVLLIYGPVLFYNLLCEILLDGQSVGKKALQIKVVRLDGAQASLSSYLLRWLVGLVELRLFVGSLAMAAMILTRNGQRLGDLAGGTVVVKVKRATSLSQTIFAKLGEDYQPTFATVGNLGDRDVAIIKEVITSRERSSDPIVLGRLTRKVKEVLGVESDLPSLKFLRTVVRDYNYYAGRG